MFFGHDGGFVDIADLLSGRLTPVPLQQLYVLSIATGSEVPISGDELDVLLSVSGDAWVDAEQFDPDVVKRLHSAGLLVGEDDRERLAQDARLRDSGWNLHAAAYHFLTRWRGMDIRGADGDVAAPTEEGVRAFLELHGDPPPPFFRAEGVRDVVELPAETASGGLYEALAERRTTRNFDGSRALPLRDFAVVLAQVFGVHATATAADDRIVTLKRTSPSGGGLHPIEAYPLVTNVEGVPPGLYHYDAAHHALALLEPLDAVAARVLATQFVCGQTYFGEAHVLVLLAARFNRSYWKYRRHQKAYTSILLDAGHLSQTLYLVAADLGLGAFVTTVVNNGEIDDRLGFDGIDIGAIAVSGLGVSGGRSPLDPVYRPFTSARA